MMEHKTNESYYAVIFSSKLSEDAEGYSEMAEKMDKLASQQPGFLGSESVRDASGIGITISYWESLESISNWKKNESHIDAQNKGKQQWYEKYRVRICKVEREYSLG